MAESTLALTYTSLRLAIARHLGFSLDAEKWTDDQLTVIGMVTDRGLRQFYYPPKVYDNEAPHEWSFLKPTVTIDTVATYSTGTVAITETETTVTLSDGTWPTWAATHGTLVIDTTEYAISSRDSDSKLTLSSAWAEDTITAEEYSLRHNGNYDLPDDFGGIEGEITYTSSENKPPILIVGEGMIENIRRGRTTRSYPIQAAIRPKEHTATTAGQRFEIMFGPIPNAAYTLNYKKLILPQALVASTLIHPYGGAMHSETIIASCLAIAELQEEEKQGEKHNYFMQRLIASIQIDKKAYRAEYLGYNADHSDDAISDPNFVRHPNTFLVTYNGET